MARGDYVEVTYRTGAGTDKEKILVDGVGGSVGVEGAQDRSTFLRVEVLDRNKQTIRTAHFARTEVVAIIEGHDTFSRSKIKVERVK